MDKKGNKEVKELIVFFALLGNAGDAATKNGLSYDDAVHFAQPLLEAPKAFAGISEVPAELNDLDQEEINDIYTTVAQRLDLADDQVEALVEKAFGAMLNLYGVYLEIKKLRG